jgi:hypothetical protein
MGVRISANKLMEDAEFKKNRQPQNSIQSEDLEYKNSTTRCLLIIIVLSYN